MFFYLDEFEPATIEQLLVQTCDCTRAGLNRMKLSDYYIGVDSKTMQFSRKQAGELLSDLDEAERQIREYYPNAEENYQIVEGIISTVPLSIPSRKQYYAQKSRGQRVLDPFEGKKLPAVVRDAKSGKLLQGNLYSYSVNDYGGIANEKHHKVNAQMYWSWIAELNSCGVTTFFTLNYVETARFLATVYKHYQKESHNTLNRYIKPRITIEKQDPQVLTLMGIVGAELGEVKAKELIERFGDVYSVLTADMEELQEVIGIGKKYAQKIRDSVRRSNGE